jgi:hypothetical protein
MFYAQNSLMSYLRLWRNLFFSSVLCLPLTAQAAATFQLVNLDGPGEGFNDTTPFVAVGGNLATTLGQARLNAFQYAANILGGLVTSGVTIRVEINMDPMFGSESSASLGSVKTNTAFANFDGAPVANTLYVEALANKLAGKDLSPGTNDISATFNSSLDNGTVLGSTNWYYGLDGNAGGHIDFVSVALHELVHGLGFLNLLNLATGAKAAGLDDAFIRHLEHHGASPADFPSMTDAQRVNASTSDPNLHWTGPAVTAAAGGHVRMHGPNPQQGESVSHFSSALSPNQLMEPSYTGPVHSLGLAAQVLTDIGWPVSSPPPPPPSSMALPTGPTPFSCQDGAGGVFNSTNPAAARPLGAVNASSQLAVQLGTVAFSAAVDVYVVAQLPSGGQFIMNSSKQWLPYPVNTVPYRAGSSSAFSLDILWQVPLASISPGTYAAYTVIVPAGTNPAAFNLASSNYYLWCTTRTLP